MSLSKKLYWKVLCGWSFLTGDTVSNIGFFDPAFWTVAPLTFYLVQSPPPLPRVNKYTVYTIHVYSVNGGGGVWNFGPQADKHLPQSPFPGQRRHFLIAFYESYLSSVYIMTSVVSNNAFLFPCVSGGLVNRTGSSNSSSESLSFISKWVGLV